MRTLLQVIENLLLGITCISAIALIVYLGGWLYEKF